ncbi:MAG: Hsp70 family protein [Magnetococcales bacterium]|nr:Hsp70 family protein [Magnetococcales bacterium]
MSKTYIYHPPGATGERQSSVIPSLIHFGGKKGNLKVYVGAEVEDAGLTSHRGTIRWAKLDILRGNVRATRINDELITPRDAAELLIERVLLATGGLPDEDLILTVPVEASEAYEEWLKGSALRQFRGTVRVLDEATACILGYDTHVREGQVYVLFDFGAGTLDVSVVKTSNLAQGNEHPKVLGRAGEEIGGSLIDQWLLKEVQRSNDLSEDELADVGTALLFQVEDAKIRLSNGEKSFDISQLSDATGRLISHEFSSDDLRRILETPRPELRDRSLFQSVTRTIERALEEALDKYGTRKSDVKGVFMAGGTSLLLGMAGVVRNLFSDCPVHCEDPFEAIARGACRYAGEDISLTLVHDYCLRAWDAERKEVGHTVIVSKGTQYPTEKPVTVKYLKATCEGATKLGIVVVERSVMISPEPIFGVKDGIFQEIGTRRREETVLWELNPEDREFIHADPPCAIGSRRFVVGFGVDANRRLTLTLRDQEPDNHSFVQFKNGERIDLPVRDLPIVSLTRKKVGYRT